MICEKIVVISLGFKLTNIFLRTIGKKPMI